MLLGSLTKEALNLAELGETLGKHVGALGEGIRDAGGGAMSKWNANFHNPLLGEAAARQAQHGIYSLSGNSPIIDESMATKQPFLHRLLGGTKWVNDANELKGKRGLITDYLGAEKGDTNVAQQVASQSKGQLSFAPNNAIGGQLDDKLKEIQPGAFKGYIPHAVDYDDMRKKYNLDQSSKMFPQQAAQAFDKEMGPNQWVLKEQMGANSMHSPDKQIYMGGKDTIDINKGNQRYKDWMLQKKIESKQVYDPTSPTGHSPQEYRVHVMNGKVVPYATFERGMTKGGKDFRAYMSMMFPGKNPAMVENYVREALSKANPTLRKGSYGFDIGMDTANKPFMVEANATDRATSFSPPGVSGYLGRNPIVQQAYSSAIKGNVPAYVLARRGLYGATAAGTATGAGMLANREYQQYHQPPMPARA